MTGRQRCASSGLVGKHVFISRKPTNYNRGKRALPALLRAGQRRVTARPTPPRPPAPPPPLRRSEPSSRCKSDYHTGKCGRHTAWIAENPPYRRLGEQGRAYGFCAQALTSSGGLTTPPEATVSSRSLSARVSTPTSSAEAMPNLSSSGKRVLTVPAANSWPPHRGPPPTGAFSSNGGLLITEEALHEADRPILEG